VKYQLVFDKDIIYVRSSLDFILLSAAFFKVVVA